MNRPVRLLAVALMPLLGVSCSQFNRTETPMLGEVRYYYVDMFSAYDRDMQISPDGQVVVAERKGNTHGDARQVVGHLTAAEIADLAAAFKGWNELKPFYASDINSVVQIKYDGYQVQTSSILRTPENFNRVKSMLDKIATTTLAAAPQSATQPATAATAPRP